MQVKQLLNGVSVNNCSDIHVFDTAKGNLQTVKKREGKKKCPKSFLEYDVILRQLSVCLCCDFNWNFRVLKEVCKIPF